MEFVFPLKSYVVTAGGELEIILERKFKKTANLPRQWGSSRAIFFSLLRITRNGIRRSRAHGHVSWPAYIFKSG